MNRCRLQNEFIEVIKRHENKATRRHFHSEQGRVSERLRIETIKKNRDSRRFYAE